MFAPGRGGPPRRMLGEIIARFREKGATSPERAMTSEELGLPPRFEQAMHRRLGATGIFVEVNGRYYLDEARLKQVQEQRGAWASGGMGMWKRNMAMRIVRMVVGLTAVVLALTNLLVVRSLDLSLVVLALVIVWIALTIYQIFYFSRMRRSWPSQRMGGPAMGA